MSSGPAAVGSTTRPPTRSSRGATAATNRSRTPPLPTGGPTGSPSGATWGSAAIAGTHLEGEAGGARGERGLHRPLQGGQQPHRPAAHGGSERAEVWVEPGLDECLGGRADVRRRLSLAAERLGGELSREVHVTTVVVGHRAARISGPGGQWATRRASTARPEASTPQRRWASSGATAPQSTPRRMKSASARAVAGSSRKPESVRST